MFGDPPGGEALNLRDPFGELARDEALDLPADQRDLELHRCGEFQARALPRRGEQRPPAARSQGRGRRDADLPVYLAVTDRSPGLRMQYFQIARDEFGDQPGQQLTAQVLGDVHRHGAVRVDDSESSVLSAPKATNRASQ